MVGNINVKVDINVVSLFWRRNYFFLFYYNFKVKLVVNSFTDLTYHNIFWRISITLSAGICFEVLFFEWEILHCLFSGFSWLNQFWNYTKLNSLRILVFLKPPVLHSSSFHISFYEIFFNVFPTIIPLYKIFILRFYNQNIGQHFMWKKWLYFSIYRNRCYDIKIVVIFGVLDILVSCNDCSTKSKLKFDCSLSLNVIYASIFSFSK